MVGPVLGCTQRERVDDAAMREIGDVNVTVRVRPMHLLWRSCEIDGASGLGHALCSGHLESLAART